MRLSGLIGLMLAGGCAAAQPVGPKPAPEGKPPAPRCEPVDVARGERAFEGAKPFLEHLRHEEHPRIEVFEQGVRDLEEAAVNGSLEGQHRFASVVFGFSFTDHAPEAADEKDYVRAFAFFRVAALRGHPRVLSSFPGIDAKSVDGLRLEEPLTSIPKPWLVKAFEKADAWMACAPDAAKTRYVEPPPPEKLVLDKTDSGWTKRGDAEGAMLRVTDTSDIGAGLEPPITTRYLEALPELYACYSEWLRREPQATAALSVLVKLPANDLQLTGAVDGALKSCARAAFAGVKLPTDAERSARFEVALYPRALSAPELPEAREGTAVDRWEADGSCWMTVTYPCAPKKMCMAPTRERVRCKPTPD